MKTIINVFVVVLLTCFNYESIAQCTPNQNFINSGYTGVSPNMMANGTKNSPYQMNYTLVVEDSISIDVSNYVPTYLGIPIPNFPALAAINTVTLESVTGLPNGLSVSYCSPQNCEWPGGGSGCFTISGTPTQTGVFYVTVTIKKNVSIPGLTIPSLPVPLPPMNNQVGPSEDIASWTISIDSASTSGGNNGNSGNNGNTSIDEHNLEFDLGLYPNPALTQTLLKYHNPQNRDINILIINHLGAIVDQFVISTSGETIINTDKMESGIYFIKAFRDGLNINKKLLVQ